MSAALLGSYEAGSPEWDEARRGRLGGSEIAAVLARNVERLDLLPLYRVIHDRQVVGLTYRLGGVWHAHVVDPSSTTVHHSRKAAVESIRRGGWAE